MAAPGIKVTDASNPTNATRNHTVIAAPGPSFLLLASQVVSGGYAPADGDYFHRYVLWDSGAGYDAPNGQEATFNEQMTAWCSTCHTRYLATTFAPQNDAIYKRRHMTTDRLACTTCHVSHGSNAAMTGPYSSTYPYPNNTAAVPSVSASSRLLKLDNRGTCQACHDPTGSIKAGDTTNPPPPTTTGTLSGTVTGTGIVMNPPYVATRTLDTLMPELRRHEPRIALDGGPAGLDCIRRIIREAPAFLRPRGWLLVEMGPEQTETALAWMGLSGQFEENTRIQDYSRRFRVVAGRRKA